MAEGYTLDYAANAKRTRDATEHGSEDGSLEGQEQKLARTWPKTASHVKPSHYDCDSDDEAALETWATKYAEERAAMEKATAATEAARKREARRPANNVNKRKSRAKRGLEGIKSPSKKKTTAKKENGDIPYATEAPLVATEATPNTAPASQHGHPDGALTAHHSDLGHDYDKGEEYDEYEEGDLRVLGNAGPASVASPSRTRRTQVSEGWRFGHFQKSRKS